MKPSVILFMLLSSLFSCSRLTSNPQAVAERFLKQVYSLDYNGIETISSGDALLQVALLQGRLDSLDKNLSLSYINTNITLTNLAVDNKLGLAKVDFITTLNEIETNNSLMMQKIKGQWMVVSIEKSPIPVINKFFVN